MLLLLTSIFLAQSWDQWVAICLQKKLLLKYYSLEKIESEKIQIIHLHEKTMVSNGIQLPQFEHDEYVSEYFSKTWFSKLIILATLVYSAFCMRATFVQDA